MTSLSKTKRTTSSTAVNRRPQERKVGYKRAVHNMLPDVACNIRLFTWGALLNSCCATNSVPVTSSCAHTFRNIICPQKVYKLNDRTMHGMQPVVVQSPFLWTCLSLTKENLYNIKNCTTSHDSCIFTCNLKVWFPLKWGRVSIANSSAGESSSLWALGFCH